MSQIPSGASMAPTGKVASASRRRCFLFQRCLHEIAHGFQIQPLIQMQQMIAREPVQIAITPVLVQQMTMLGWRKAVAGTADDHAPGLGYLAGPGEGRMQGGDFP